MAPKTVKPAAVSKEQDWWFVREEMHSARYTQKCVSYTEILKTDITMEHCLSMTDAKNVADFSFFIFSSSMAAAVQLLSDESIITTYNLYCTEDPVVTIIIRAVDEPSPNTSHAPSHHSSLSERRKVSGRRGLLSPELFIQPSARNISGGIDIYTMDTLATEDTVVLCLGDDDFVAIGHEYLLGWIDAKLNDSTPITKISVESLGPDGSMRKFVLSAEIWQKSLLRGPWKNNTPGFWQSCQNFVRDLRSFGSDSAARKRIENTGHQFYLGKPYFDLATTTKLLVVPTNDGTLLDTLKKLETKRAGSTICASHDLAPLFEGELCVSWNKTESKATAHPIKPGFLTNRPIRKASFDQYYI
ncbi:hypothetical protein F5Y16DRAFT_412257 [Xylariaceae sp. FL0255]|nr:hypothetical protein F5Y16DRAFT_412257 [Xylariaceae sp. FL0255]